VTNTKTAEIAEKTAENVQWAETDHIRQINLKASDIGTKESGSQQKRRCLPIETGGVHEKTLEIGAKTIVHSLERLHQTQRSIIGGSGERDSRKLKKGYGGQFPTNGSVQKATNRNWKQGLSTQYRMAEKQKKKIGKVKTTNSTTLERKNTTSPEPRERCTGKHGCPLMVVIKTLFA